MYVLHRAGRWIADLLESFDDALIALDRDIEHEPDTTPFTAVN